MLRWRKRKAKESIGCYVNRVLDGYRRFGYCGVDDICGVVDLFPWQRPSYRYVRITPLFWKQNDDRLAVWGRVWLRNRHHFDDEPSYNFAHLWWVDGGALCGRRLW